MPKRQSSNECSFKQKLQHIISKDRMESKQTLSERIKEERQLDDNDNNDTSFMNDYTVNSNSNHITSPTKKKKQRRTNDKAVAETTDKASYPDDNNRQQVSSLKVKRRNDTTITIKPNNKSSIVIMDMETALAVFFSQNDTSKIDPCSREWLYPTTNDNQNWIQFRVGHAGDVSAITSLYRSIPNHPSQNTTDDLEWKLTNGLGDEQTPPSIYSILVYIHSSSPKNDFKTIPATVELVCAVFFNIEWNSTQRTLHVCEWLVSQMITNKNILVLLEKRITYRLSALALATGCSSLVLPSILNKNDLHTTQPVRYYGTGTGSTDNFQAKE